MARTIALDPEATIWGRVIDPERADFAPEDRARMNELAAKAREGALGEAEDRELDA